MQTWLFNGSFVENREILRVRVSSSHDGSIFFVSNKSKIFIFVAGYPPFTKKGFRSQLKRGKKRGKLDFDILRSGDLTVRGNNVVHFVLFLPKHLKFQNPEQILKKNNKKRGFWRSGSLKRKKPTLLCTKEERKTQKK